MPKSKKPAPKGGKKNAAPKKGRASNEPTPIEETNPPMPPLTVEEQWETELRVHGTEPRAEIPPPRLPGKKPGLLRRALYRFRSAVSGLFVSKKFAEANPDTTVREKAD